jgi:hypothetical protein
MDIANIKAAATELKKAVMDGTSTGDSSATINIGDSSATMRVYYSCDGYGAAIYIDDVDANDRRWLDHQDFWVYQESVELMWANIYGSDHVSWFAKLAKQASEDERLSSVDAQTLPGRLGRAAGVKANLFREEARYWRALDRKAKIWSRSQAHAGKGPRARLAARLADALGGVSEFSYADAEFGISAYWRVSWDI